MQPLPPQLDSAVEGLHQMTITLPAYEAELDLSAAAGNLLLVGLGVVQIGVGLIFDLIGVVCVSLVVESVLAFALGWPRLLWKEKDYRLELRPHQLLVDEKTFAYGDLEDVAWVCEAPKTTLRILCRDGRTHRFECLRRGAHGGRGVTRKQREWVESTLDGKIQQAAPRDVPRALETLVTDRH